MLVIKIIFFWLEFDKIVCQNWVPVNKWAQTSLPENWCQHPLEYIRATIWSLRYSWRRIRYSNFGFCMVHYFNKIKFSSNPTDFSTASFQNLNFNSTAVWMNNLFGNNKPYFYSFSINSNQFTPGMPIYMRIYTQDSQHSTPTEIPSSGLDFYLQSYFSFVVAP